MWSGLAAAPLSLKELPLCLGLCCQGHVGAADLVTSLAFGEPKPPANSTTATLTLT